MNIHQILHYMFIVMDAVEDKTKESHSDFLGADSESFRFSFPGKWQVWIQEEIFQCNLLLSYYFTFSIPNHNYNILMFFSVVAECT